MFHIENTFASGLKKRPRGPRSSSSEELISNIPASLGRTLIDLNTHAKAYYVRYHLQTVADTPGILLGVSDDILPVWTSKERHPILELAVSSMALAVFSQAQHDPQAAIEASLNYQKLLQSARMTISSLDGGNIVPCLLAIWFMGRYEQTEHRPSHIDPRTPFASQLRSIKHHDGALAILKTWKHYISHHQPVTDVIKHTRRSMIKSALLRNYAIPKWMLNGIYFGEQGFDLEYDRIVVQLANLRQRLSTLSHETHKGGSAFTKLFPKIEELGDEIQRLDQASHVWATRIPSDWSPKLHEVADSQVLPTTDFYSPVVYTYPSLVHAAVWNQSYATRMLIHSTWLKILDLRDSIADCPARQQRVETFCNLESMANDLASSMPFCLQRIDIVQGPNTSSPQESVASTPNRELKPYVAALAVWPLSIASGLRNLDVGHQIWFRSQLARLGKPICERMFECADTNHWLEL